MLTAAVILAAGASTRFGARKQDAMIGGRRMIEIIAGTAAAVGLDPVVAVVPPRFAVPPDVIPVVNAEPGAGISRSLRLGVAAVPPDVEAAVVLLGDEPLIGAPTLRQVVGLGAGGAPVVAARFGDRIGPPVLLRREAFDLVERTAGDDGLGRLLREVPDLGLVDLPNRPADVDTREDLDALQASWGDRPER